MKILFLCNKFPYPPKDGGSIATLNMMEGLQASGNEVSCLALNTSKHYFPPEELPAELRDKIGFTAVNCDCSIRPADLIRNLLLSREPYIAERFRKADLSRALAALLKQEHFDLVQLEGPYMGHYLEQVRKAGVGAVSLRAHNVEHLIWERKARHEKNPLKRWYLKNMARRIRNFEWHLLRRVDFLIPISTVDEAIFRKQGFGIPSFTIPAGLDMEAYPFSLLPAAKDIFFIGALDWLPNQEGLQWFLDEIFEDLRKEEPEMSFHVAGRNAPDYMKKELQKEGIVFHGEVEDARAFMKEHCIMVAPLLTGSGIRIKILESMAMGRPVVSTSIGAEGIPAKQGVHILLSDRPEEFLAHMITLIREEEVASSMAAKARALIQENFDTFGLSARLSRFLKEQV